MMMDGTHATSKGHGRRMGGMWVDGHGMAWVAGLVIIRTSTAANMRSGVR